VFGFLSGYADEEGLETGSRYFLLALADHYTRVDLRTSAFLGFSATVLAGIIAWTCIRRREPQQMLAAGLTLTLAGTLIFSPHYPWYFLWLLPFSVILAYLPGVVLTLGAAYWFGGDLTITDERMFRLNEYLYGMFLLAMVADWLVRSLRRMRQAHAKIREEEIILATRTPS
jgi:hypothetical protein